MVTPRKPIREDSMRDVTHPGRISGAKKRPRPRIQATEHAHGVTEWETLLDNLSTDEALAAPDERTRWNGVSPRIGRTWSLPLTIPYRRTNQLHLGGLHLCPRELSSQLRDLREEEIYDNLQSYVRPRGSSTATCRPRGADRKSELGRLRAKVRRPPERRTMVGSML